MSKRSHTPDCWPLPPEWDTFIPPQAIEIVHEEIPMDSTLPVWNEQWLRGLEAYIRSIVRDELNKSNKWTGSSDE